VSLGSNLLAFRKKKKLSAADLGKEIGVSKQMIYQYENDESVPGKDKLALLATVLEVKVSHLYSDEESEKGTLVKNPTEGAHHKIPFYDTVAVGGYSVMADQTAVGSPTEMIEPGTFLRSASGSLRIYGHSMFPKYPAGCIVAFKDADIDVIIWGEDYVIELSDRRIIKRIEKGKDPMKILAVSYNKSESYIYDTIELPIIKIKRLYMVLGKIELEASI